MKKIFTSLTVLLIAFSLNAQNKNMTIYHTGGTKTVVDISATDSIVIFICGASKVSYGGKDYNTVLIGDQCWLKENLDIGTMILNSVNSTQSNSEIEKYCYNNDPNNCTTYGGLYQWQEAMQYATNEGARGICPEGWHIPSLAEFNTLNESVGGDGNSLKAVGQGIQPNGLGTNISGFSGLLAGNKEPYPGSYFFHLTLYGHFWSSSKDINNNVDHLVLYYDSSTITNHIGIFSTYGFNVRCLKD